MLLPITTSFFGLFVPVYVALSLRVVRTRRKNRVSLGDGQVPELVKIISTHNNFSQYIPLGLLGIALGELQYVSSAVLVCVGVALLCGRVFHAIGILKAKSGPNLPRVLGMMLTFVPLTVLALVNVWRVVRS